MVKLCEIENCKKTASYAKTYGNPIRCITHKENLKPQKKVCMCGKACPAFNFEGKVPMYCSKCKETEMINIRTPKCIICKKVTPNFNYPNEKKATHCSSCKKDGMVNIKVGKCQECKQTIPTYNFPGQKAAFCAKCKKDGMVDVKSTFCIVCKKVRACFGLNGKRTHCVSCKTKNMVDVISKKCTCGKQPSFAKTMNDQPTCCKDCKEDGMINVKNPLCISCNKVRPSFNFENQGKATHCKNCKKDGMINVSQKTCSCGSGRQPGFSWPDEKGSTHCGKCKIYGMIDRKHEKCKCKKSAPNFGFPGEPASRCSECKDDGMINVHCLRCIVCKITQPSYANSIAETATHCGKCKTKDMVQVKNPTCQECKSRASYNFKGKEPLFCAKHKTSGMIHLRVVKCKGQNGSCEMVGNSKYRGYCTFCFSHEFPTDPLTFQIRAKTKELAVRDFINYHFNGFVHDKPLWVEGCDCTHRRRIDHRKLIGNTLLCIETDEYQHISYDKQNEIDRYHDCYMALSGKMIFIRFNPDPFVDKKGAKQNPELNERLYALKKEVEKQISRIENEENEELLEVVYMYYNEK